MKFPAIDDAFFLGKALLLVEDPLTRVVLSECWREPASVITVRAVGGSIGVQRLVTAAREQGHRHVFGLVDRDFAGPAGAGDPVRRTERHEIENHLLDYAALARLSKGKTATEIEEIATKRAESLQAWMAVRRTMVEMKQDLPGFPSDPKVNEVPDASTATKWLKGLTYPKNLERQLSRKWSANDLLNKRFPYYFQYYSSEVTSKRWIELFSGKEIFRHLRSVVPWRIEFDSDDDLARKVAEHWQREASTPTFINDLRDAILAGSGL